MNDRWTPGIGDPGWLGWGTVVAYVLTAAACALVVGRADPRQRTDRWFWGAAAALMLALGINKQLDLQSLLTQVVRDSARLHGWYDERRALQLTFIFGLAAMAAMLFAALWRVSPLLRRNMRGASVGIIFVVTYVFLRACSFHHVDLFINRTVLGIRWNVILELAGIAAILVSALRQYRFTPPARA